MITFLVWIPAVLDGIMTLTSEKDVLFPVLSSGSYTALEPTAYRCNIPSCDDPQDFNFLDFPPDLLFPSLAENSSGSTDYCHYYRLVQPGSGKLPLWPQAQPGGKRHLQPNYDQRGGELQFRVQF